jgi:competence protein ComEA
VLKQRSWWLGAVAGLVVGVVGTALLLALSRRVGPAPIVIVPPAPTVAPTATGTATPTDTPAPLAVYVTGAVAAPAVVVVPAGSRAEAAIAAAGGFAADAQAAAINLALPLADGMQLHVPSAATPVALPAVSLAPAPAAGDALDGVDGGPLDLNRADAAALDGLPGIGPATAAAIIAFREENGPFGALEDLLNVPGIGPAKLAQLEGLVVVGQ